jgi:hypothetical protein
MDMGSNEVGSHDVGSCAGGGYEVGSCEVRFAQL